jgi:hypothetical protein
MSGNLARRRQTKFMPADFRLIEARQPPLKDQYDEWLARIICYAFSVPVSAFVSLDIAMRRTIEQQKSKNRIDGRSVRCIFGCAYAGIVSAYRIAGELAWRGRARSKPSTLWKKPALPYSVLKSGYRLLRERQ